MSALSTLIGDVELTLARRSGRARARTLSRLTDLLVRDAERLGEAQVELFDQVILRFADTIELHARRELAERLSRLPNGPRAVLRHLALDDEIVVARPVLSRSPRLDDQDLMVAAAERGREHRLAICERKHLSAMVAETILIGNDPIVRRAVARNPGARLSALATATLLAEARADEELQDLLGARSDLSEREMGQLIGIAKETVRRRLLAALPASDAAEIAAALEIGADAVEAALGRPPDPDDALDGLRAAIGGRPVTEADLERFASAGLLDEAASALAVLTGLSRASAERMLGEDGDILLVVAAARGWAWPTVRSLLRARGPARSLPHHLRRAQNTFESIATATAERVLRFLLLRDGAERARREQAPGGHGPAQAFSRDTSPKAAK